MQRPATLNRWRSSPMLRVVGFAVLVFLGQAAGAQQPAEWKTGVAFERQLAAPVSLHSTGTPLGEQLENLAATQHVAIWRDRRVDPDRRVATSLNRTPLGEAIAAIAAKSGHAITSFDSLVYVGPREAAADLRTVAALAADSTARLPADARARLQAKAAWSWPLLSEPRQLVEQLAEAYSEPIEGTEQIPHDLWRAADLPPLSLHDRLTLVLYGFGLTYRAASSGAGLEIVAIDESPRLVRDYRRPRSSDLEAYVAKLKEIVPTAEYRIAGGKVWARGRWEDHQQIAAIVAGRSPRRETPMPRPGGEGGIDVYTLTIQDAKIGPLMQQLGQRLGLTVQFDQDAIDKAGLSLDTAVSFQVTGARLEELLDAALRPAGLGYQKRGQTLQIIPARPNE